MFHLARDRGPLRRQLRDHIEVLVKQGALAPGTRLPSSRALARALGVSRNTVLEAYEALAADGLLAPAGRRGTRVSGSPVAASESTAAASPPGWDRLFSAAVDGLPLPPAGRETWWDEEAAGALRRCLDQVLHDRGVSLLAGGPAEGYLPLRELLAAGARQGGSTVRPDEVLIVNGYRQALYLACRAFLNPDDLVLTQEPANPEALACFRRARARIAGVPVSASGLDLNSLGRLLDHARPKLLYLMPSFHEPTGVTMDLSTRLAVLDQARRHGFLIIEDVRGDDLIYPGHLIPPLKAHDRSGHVIQISTTLQSPLPGLALGWVVAAPPALQAMAAIKAAEDTGPGIVLQAAVYEFCCRGHCARHFGRARRIHRAVLGAMTRALARHLPPDVRWAVNPASLSAWIELPPDRPPGGPVGPTTGKKGVLEPGSSFFVDGGGERCFRYSWPYNSFAGLQTEVRAVGESLAGHEEAKNPQ